MARFKRGDRVVIADRETTAADRKGSLYYPHFRGLRGVVDQAYDLVGEVCVEVDLDSLPADILRRHQGMQDQARSKWLNGLSEQERKSLPSEQKDLRLKYTLMIAAEDLLPGKAPDTPAAEPAASQSRSPARTRRLTEADLLKAEEEHLQEVLRRAEDSTGA